MKGCRSCNNWQAIDEHLDRVDRATSGQKVQVGLCRRYAPRPTSIEVDAGRDHALESYWPRVASDDYCGEWDPRFD